MQELFYEALLIAILILLNGYLAGTEIAVVTARKSQIKQLAESGNRNAKIFLKLKEEPDRFLATIQIGITSVGVLASAVGGAAAVKVIEYQEGTLKGLQAGRKELWPFLLAFLMVVLAVEMVLANGMPWARP